VRWAGSDGRGAVEIEEMGRWGDEEMGK